MVRWRLAVDGGCVISDFVQVVLIAAKELGFAKQRLAPVFPPAERMALARAMFHDVLAAAFSARSADRVAVVTSDPSLAQLAVSSGACVIDEQFPRGLNVAVQMASEVLTARGTTRLCTVLSDIPAVTGADIDSVFEALPLGQSAVMVPSRDLSGTNIIARTPPMIIPTRFGRLSLLRHIEDCRRLGLPSKVLQLGGPDLDLDQLSDLVEFVRAPAITHTGGELARLGITAGRI